MEEAALGGNADTIKSELRREDDVALNPTTRSKAGGAVFYGLVNGSAGCVMRTERSDDHAESILIGPDGAVLDSVCVVRHALEVGWLRVQCETPSSL